MPGMRPLTLVLLFVVFAFLPSPAADTPFQVITWPESGQPVLRLSFSKFKQIAGMGKERTYITDTTAENLSGKAIASENLSLYVFDKSKARIGVI